MESLIGNDVERLEIRRLLERVFFKRPISPFGTADVLVHKLPLHNGTHGGIRATADMRQ
jgi:hypothetical protein